MDLFSNLLGRKPNGWSTDIGWCFVVYNEGRKSVILQIEPMAKGPDRVYVPADAAWSEQAPMWAKERKAEILGGLRAFGWRRELDWQTTPDESFLESRATIPGSLESTSGGQFLESQRMLYPDSQLTHELSHEIWHEAEVKFAESASGDVAIFADEVDPASVFGAISLPAFRENSNVNLNVQE